MGLGNQKLVHTLSLKLAVSSFPQTGGMGAFPYRTTVALSVGEFPEYGQPEKPKEELGRFGNRTQVIDLPLVRWCESGH